MIVINNYIISIVMCVITMVCWGSWANTTKLTDGTKWSFQLYYWDYCIGIVIFSVIFALTFGSFGHEGRSFFEDISQAKLYYLFLAFLGGVIFNLGNILLVAAIDLAGMAVAFPVGVGIALVLGVVVNYLGLPKGNPVILFSGVAAIVVAIILTAIAYGRLNKDTNGKAKGLITAIFAGIIMGWFYRFVASSMSSNFSTPEYGLLTPYTALVLFSIGILLSSFIWNIIMMKKPVNGFPVTGAQYFRGTFKDHCAGLLGGIIWSLGMSFSVLASSQAGYAISYGLGQGATMIAVIWGVFVWKEFSSANRTTKNLLFAMFVFYIVGIVTIILANEI
ncbi:multidrug DMT transporter permease [Salmonella enterica subsp. enterica]|nr:multidrug DMT transporter permease [Salmonella enterica subsp. enterica]